MELYFIRHPETIANKNKIIYGRTDYDYSEKGQQMVEVIPGKLEKLEIEKLYSSPLGRASKLAEAIAQQKNMEVRYDDRIMEMNVGILDGLKFDDAKVTHKEIMDNLAANFTEFKIPGGESCDTVFSRAKSFLDEIKGQGEPCLIVAHAMLIHLSMAYLLNMEIKNIWRLMVEPGTLLHVGYKKDYGVLKAMIPYKDMILQD